jgi:hypothetical protein
VAVADLMANLEVFTVNLRRGCGNREECGVDGATRGDGAGDDELDEITT